MALKGAFGGVGSKRNSSTSKDSISALVASSSGTRRAKARPKQELDYAIANFEAAISEKPQTVKQFKKLSATPVPDPGGALQMVEDLSRECAKHDKLRNAIALKTMPFFDQIRLFAPLGDIVVGGAQNLIASGVWAAVRLALELSVSYLSFFEKVSSMLCRIGKSNELHQDFVRLFPQDERLQNLSFEYMAIVVNIATEIVRYVKKSFLKQIAAPAFTSVFQPLEYQLKDIGEQIRACTDLVSKQEDEKRHALTQRMFSAVQLASSADLRKRELLNKRQVLLTELRQNQSVSEKIFRGLRSKGTSTWLMEENAYNDWGHLQSPALLYLRGKLGSGKSVVMASLVSYLSRNRETSIRLRGPGNWDAVPPSVCYWFCDPGDQKCHDTETILKSLVGQALSTCSMEPYLLDYIQKKEAYPLVTPRDYLDLLLEVTPKDWMGHIVIDGLDDCSREVVTGLCQELKYLSENRRIYVVLSTRTLSEHSKRLTSVLGPGITVTMEDVNRSAEIDSYISMKLSESDHDLEPRSKEIIQEALQELWDGMFLWLSLQIVVILDDLDAGVPIRDITENLPKELDETYSRALLRIRDQDRASRIMKLVAAADPALSLDELRVAALVTPGEKDCDPVALPSQASAFLRQYGGHLLELDEDEKIHFIHHSTLRHLVNTAQNREASARQCFFTLPDAKSHLAAVCVTYLNFPAWNQALMKYSGFTQIDVPGQVTNTVMSQTATSSARLHGVLKAFKSRGLLGDSKQANVERLFSQWTKDRSAPADDMQALLPYARKNWLTMTQYLDLGEQKLRRYWSNILISRVQAAPVPWESVMSGDGLHLYRWITINSHHCLFESLFSLDYPYKGQKIHIDDIVMGPPGGIVGPCLLPVILTKLEYGNNFDGYVDSLMPFIFPSPTGEAQELLSSSMIAQVQRSARMFILLLIEHIDDPDLALPLMPYLTPWVDLSLPLLHGQTAAELAYAREKGRLLDHVETKEFQHPVRTLSWPKRDKEHAKSLFLRASRAGNTECAEWLIQYGSNLNSVHPDGATALTQEARYGHLECVQTLLDHGADINATDHSKATALMWALEHVGTASLLIEEGININAKDRTGCTALHMAAKKGFRAALILLLAQSDTLDLNAQNNDGNTALQEACKQCETACVQLLATAGAGIELKNKKGEKALDIARINMTDNHNHPVAVELVTLLESLHADERGDAILS